MQKTVLKLRYMTYSNTTLSTRYVTMSWKEINQFDATCSLLICFLQLIFFHYFIDTLLFLSVFSVNKSSFLTPLCVFLRTANTTVILKSGGLSPVSKRKERKLPLTPEPSASSLQLNSSSVLKDWFRLKTFISFLSQPADILLKMKVKKIPKTLAFSVMLVTLTLQQETDIVFALVTINALEKWDGAGRGGGLPLLIFLWLLCALYAILPNSILQLYFF